MLRYKTKFIYLIIMLLSSFIHLKAQVESEKDSLESLLPYAKDNQRADIYIGLAEAIKQNDTSNAISYAKQALKISNSLSYDKGIAGANIILGYIDRNNGNYKSAKIRYLFAVSYALKSNDLNTIAWAYQNMGNLYYIQSDYPKAMRYYLGALKKGEEAGNLKRIALASNQIGSLYSSINDTDRAAFFYQKAFNILKDLGDEIAYARISTNLGNIYKSKGEFIRALYHYNQSLEVFRRHKLLTDISAVLNNVGTIYLAQKKIKKAFPFIAESYLIDLQSKDMLSVAISSMNLSSYYFETKKIDSAIFYGEISLNTAKNNNFGLEYTEACLQLSKIYNSKGNKERAFYYLNESNNSQVLSANKGAEIEGVRSDFEKAKKDEVLNKLDAENKESKSTAIESKLNSQKKNVLLLVLVCVIVFLILISILFFYFLTQKKKTKNLEITSASKSNILNRINHELRTPLNSLINYSYLANESKNLSELREYLSGINASSNDLLFSMNNIVSYLQIDAKNDLVFEEHFDFLDVLKSIFSTFQIQCNQKGILFSQLISPELPRYLKADKTKITTIIQNLLNNALKFSENGVIKIEIKHLTQDKIQNLNVCSILISVTDEGKGLNGKTLKDLILNTKKESNNGFGLGLYIVKKHVEKLNGSFELSNNETIGCNAMVKFESIIDNIDDSKDNISNLNNITQNKNLSILLVEDDLTNSYTLQKILERKGFNVICVDKGKDAFTELLKTPIDIVLIDLGLPDMSGLDVAKCIRLGGEFSLEKDIPIIALSANADPIEKQDCVAYGINEYLTKPINIELLINKMNVLVK